MRRRRAVTVVSVVAAFLLFCLGLFVSAHAVKVAKADVVRDIAFSPDGGHLVVVFVGGIQGWSTDWNGETVTIELLAEAAAYSPDSSILAVAVDREVRLLRATTGEVVRVLSGHAGEVTDVAWSPDGRHLATASADGAVRIWLADTGRRVRIFEANAGGVRVLAYSPDGTLLATGGADGLVRLFRPDTSTVVSTLDTGGSDVSSLAFSPDGRALVVAGPGGGSVDYPGIGPAIWNVTDGTSAGAVWSPSAAQSVAFSPDGREIALAGDSGLLRIQNLETGAVGLLLAGDVNFTDLAWSPDGVTLAVGGPHGVELWHAATAERVATLTRPRASWWQPWRWPGSAV